MLVAHQLTSSCASRSNTQTEYDIVKATFQQLEKDFTSNTFSSLSLLKQVAELFFQNAISIFGFLFLTKLNTRIQKFFFWNYRAVREDSFFDNTLSAPKIPSPNFMGYSLIIRFGISVAAFLLNI